MKPTHALILAVALAAAIAAVSNCGDKYAAVALPSVDAGPCGATYDDQVKGILNQYCAGCHGGNGGVSVDSFDSASQNADRALKAMTSGLMPQGGSMPATDIATFKSWTDSGKQRSCSGGGGGGADGGGSAADAGSGGGQYALTCTSGRTWSGEENAEMDPGRACVGCHNRGGGEDAPRLTTGGTVMGGPHDKDQCVGVAGAVVELTGANGQVKKLTTNSTGNFYLRSEDGSIATPFFAKITYQGRVIRMINPQSNLDCGSCHTALGASGAPGRTIAP